MTLDPVPGELLNETVDALTAALNRLSEAMASMKGIVPKRDFNEYSKYNYASKDDLYEHVRQPLAEVGMVPECTVDRIADGLVWFRLRFPGGEWETFPLPVPSGKDAGTPQKWGSLRGYAVKYWLINKLLISTGEEGVDDAKAPAAADPEVESRPPPNDHELAVGALRVWARDNDNGWDEVLAAVQTAADHEGGIVPESAGEIPQCDVAVLEVAYRLLTGTDTEQPDEPGSDETAPAEAEPPPEAPNSEDDPERPF